MEIKKRLTTPVFSLSVKKKGWNEVAYVRQGRDLCDAETSDGNGWTKRLSTQWVTTKDGTKYEIPVDKTTGKVPMPFLYAHFLNPNAGVMRTRNGKRSITQDIGIDAERVVQMPPEGFTPKDLVESGWWQAPNMCDIEDVDDTVGAQFARQLEKAAKSAQGAGKSMIFLMPEQSADRARDILAQDFNAAELKKAVKNGGIIIMEGNPGPGASGCYVSTQEQMSLKTPVIILGKGWNEETLVHEFTHHMRHVDTTRGGLTRTPFRMNSNGERVSSREYSTKDWNSSKNLEEASTVAESYARSHKVDTVNGYYSRTNSKYGKDEDEKSKHDRALLIGPPGQEKTLRGRRAENKVKAEFPNTAIGSLSYYRPGLNALEYYKQREKAGTLPVAEKPIRKPKTSAAGVTVGGTGGMIGAEASQSRKPRKTASKKITKKR